MPVTTPLPRCPAAVEKAREPVPGLWTTEFKAWVEARKFYPEAARSRGQSGAAAVRFHVGRDGGTSRTCLLASSGWPLLDTGLFKLFDGAQVPSLPAGSKTSGLTVYVTMHYELVSAPKRRESQAPSASASHQ